MAWERPSLFVAGLRHPIPPIDGHPRRGSMGPPSDGPWAMQLHRTTRRLLQHSLILIERGACIGPASATGLLALHHREGQPGPPRQARPDIGDAKLLWPSRPRGPIPLLLWLV